MRHHFIRLVLWDLIISKKIRFENDSLHLLTLKRRWPHIYYGNVIKD